MKRIIEMILNIKLDLSPKSKLSTSFSDNQSYPQFCLQASNDLQVFNTFRSNPIYNEILEHVSEKQGREYLEQIKKNPEILKGINTFKENDLFGNPRVSEYANIGKISPTTLRYVKVLTDLNFFFGNLDGFNICEIGVGYGGQCRIIDCYFSLNAYWLIDIKPALMLSRRFLDNYDIRSTLFYKTMNETEKINYDLLISNYAFSELNRKIQDLYLEKVILNSKRGYITYNEVTPPEFHSYKKQELIEIIPDSVIIEEIPFTHPQNCIIIWGDKL
ncbi:MAG: putative sugar O-methyltransferase [Desulfobacterales bacterium]